MKQFRKTRYRRIVLGVLLLIGLFPQTHIVFACTLMEGKIQFVCCCENNQKHNCKQSEQNVNCQLDVTPDYELNTANNSDAKNSFCCDLSYYELSSTLTNVTSDSHALKLLLLDAPQPPPLLATTIPTITFSYHAYFRKQSTPTTSPGTKTYSITQRFRV